MTPVLLQDFITIKAARSFPVTQSAHNWLDLGELEDLTIITDVREVSSAAPTMTIETAPVPQDSSFVTLVSFALTAGIQTNVVTAFLANVPPARFLRWKLTPSTGNGDATFRIWVAGYGWAS